MRRIASPSSVGGLRLLRYHLSETAFGLFRRLVLRVVLQQEIPADWRRGFQTPFLFFPSYPPFDPSQRHKAQSHGGFLHFLSGTDGEYL